MSRISLVGVFITLDRSSILPPLYPLHNILITKGSVRHPGEGGGVIMFMMNPRDGGARNRRQVDLIIALTLIVDETTIPMQRESVCCTSVALSL